MVVKVLGLILILVSFFENAVSFLSLAQNKWDLSKDLNLVAENFDHVDISYASLYHFVFGRNSLFEGVVIIIVGRRRHWMEALINKSRFSGIIVLRSNKDRIHFHLEVCLVELEVCRSQIHIEQTSKHSIREVEVLAICFQYLVKAGHQRRFKLCQEFVNFMHI